MMLLVEPFHVKVGIEIEIPSSLAATALRIKRIVLNQRIQRGRAYKVSIIVTVVMIIGAIAHMCAAIIEIDSVNIR